MAEDNGARQMAFELWSYSIGKEEIRTLQEVAPTSPLYEHALRKRAELGDQSSAHEIVSKLEIDEHPWGWWFHCGRIWSDPIRRALETHLEQRGRQAVKEWNWEEAKGDMEIDRLLSQIFPSEAEEFLERHWTHLRFSSRFVQTALYVGTPRSRSLAAEAIQECPDPPRLFQYIHLGEFAQAESESLERPALSLDHLESLAPYVHLLDESGIEWLWYACNRSGYFSWRRDKVDSLLSSESRRRAGLRDEDLFARLEDFADKRKSRGFMRHWLEEFRKRGDDENRAMTIVATWLRERKTLEALEVAAECVALGGRRKDLALLESSGLPPEDPQVAKVLEATRFRVFRRSLD